MTREELINWLEAQSCCNVDCNTPGCFEPLKAATMIQHDGERIAELQSALAAMTGERDRLRDYAYHSPRCATNRFGKVGKLGQMLRGDCDCGLDELLAALKENNDA